jgi:hypothetical protein
MGSAAASRPLCIEVNVMEPPTTVWTRLGRRLGMDDNPLRRRSDLVAAWLWPAAIAFFLVLAPLAMAAGNWWAHSGATSAQAAARSWHEVPAVLDEAVPGPLRPANGPDSWITWAPAHWSDGGQPHSGLIPAVAGTWAGQTVPVWLNRAGQVQFPPLSGRQVHYRVIGTELGALALLAVGLAGLGLVAGLVLNRRRVDSWESAWLSEGPQWSRQG